MNEPEPTQPVIKESVEPVSTSAVKPPTGAFVGLNEANRLTGKSKETILNYAKDGRISTVLNSQGKKSYQVVDLERVFGFKNSPTALTGKKNGSSDHSEPVGKGEPTAVKVAQLEGEIAKLTAVLEAEREKSQLLVEVAQRAEQNADKWREQADAVTRMLTHQPEPTLTPEPQPAPLPEPKKGFFGRLFGGDKR